MIVYFADHGMSILNLASNTTKNGLVIDNDVRTEEIDSGAAIFEFDLRYTESTRNSAVKCSAPGNHILRKDGTRYEYYVILETELDTKAESVHVYAEDAGLDLLNELTDGYYKDNTTAYNLKTYITKLLYDTGFTMKLNEIDESVNKVIQISEGITLMSAILTVLEAFDAEMGFSFQIEGLAVKKKYINIYEKRGKENVTNVYINSEVDNIKITKTIENLATAYRVTGGTPKDSNTPITLKGYLYDDGEYYVDTNGWLYSRTALSKWSRYQYEEGESNDVGHIVRNFTSNTTNQKTLFTRALASLKKYSNVRTTYDIDIALLPSNVRIGDTINIIDRKHELYINARILKLETSRCNNSSVATLGEFKTKKNDISEKMQQLAESFEELASKRQLFTWIAYADDSKGTGISQSATGKKYMGISTNHTNKQSSTSIADPSIYEWSKIQGEDGQEFYTWIRYADDEKGTNMSSSPVNKKYMGISYNNESQTPSTDPTKYSWSKIQGNDAVTLKISSSNGSTFKNNNGSTVMSVIITVGATVITTSTEMYDNFGSSAKIIWKEKKNGATSYTTILSTDKRIGDNGFTLTISASEIKKKTTFTCSLDY